MLIGIDGNEANLTHRVGVGQFAYHILKELHRQNRRHHFVIFLKDQPLPDMPKTKKNWRYQVFGPRALWTKIALPLHLIATHDDFKYILSLNHYSPSPSPIPTIPTIHDIGYLQDSASFTKKDFFQLKNWTQSSIRQAKLILSVSEFTKKEIISQFKIDPHKIFVIPNGVGQIIKTTPAQELKSLQKFNLTKPYFLSVGTLKPNKNYPFLIKSFAKFIKSKPDYSLVIAGKKGWLFDQIFATVQSLGLESKIFFTDYIDPVDRACLYRGADATIIPSLYEGFGIPAIESQQVGTPVISSSIPPLLEVLKNSAMFINPHQTLSLVSAMKKMINLQIRQKYSRLGLINSRRYTWAKSGKKLLNLFDTLSGV